MIVVSDTTPLISLLKISRLDLLEKLFGEVLIPSAVFNELTTDELNAELLLSKRKKCIISNGITNHGNDRYSYGGLRRT